MHVSAASPQATDPDEATFIANLPVVREVIRSVCRRFRVSHEEEAEFTSSVLLKLIDNNYEVFRRFRGACGLRTFLFAVASRHLMDRRNSEWGKWRPSKCAQRLGSAAIYLEKLVYRDRTVLPEAVALVSNHPGWRLSTNDVHSLFEQLPLRAPRPRRTEPLDGIVKQVADGDLSPSEQGERQHDLARVRVALSAALRHLDSDERQLLRLRFTHGMSILQIAAATGVDSPALYRRFPRILRRLRMELDAQELTSGGVSRLLGTAGDGLESILTRTWDDRRVVSRSQAS